MGPWGRAPPFSSCLNPPYMHHCSTPPKAALHSFTMWIRLILCTAQTWILQSGSSWAIIMTAINPNIVLPKSHWRCRLGYLPQSSLISPFCVVFHFFPLQWRRVECNGRCAAAELRVRHAALCVHQQKCCLQSYSHLFATVGLNTVSISCAGGGDVEEVLTAVSASNTDCKSPAVILPRKRDIFIVCIFMLSSNHRTEKWEAV